MPHKLAWRVLAGVEHSGFTWTKKVWSFSHILLRHRSVSCCCLAPPRGAKQSFCERSCPRFQRHSRALVRRRYGSNTSIFTPTATFN